MEQAEWTQWTELRAQGEMAGTGGWEGRGGKEGRGGRSSGQRGQEDRRSLQRLCGTTLSAGDGGLPLSHPLDAMVTWSRALFTPGSAHELQCDGHRDRVALGGLCRRRLRAGQGDPGVPTRAEVCEGIGLGSPRQAAVIDSVL